MIAADTKSFSLGYVEIYATSFCHSDYCAFNLQFRIPGIRQLAPLPFRPIAAEFSSALDRIIMITANPNRIHIYNPGTLTDTAINLSKPPLSLSVSPDGLHAAVGHDSLVTYVNLTSATVENTFPTSITSPSVVLGASWIYVLSDWNSISVNTVTGETVPASNAGFYFTGGRLHAAIGAIYGTRDGSSPNDVVKIDVSTGPMTSQTDSVYHGDYPVCGPVLISNDGSRIYTGCRSVFQASTDPSVDMHYTGRLSAFSETNGLSGESLLTSLAESAILHRIAVIPAKYIDYETYDESVIQLYESDYLNPIGTFKLPDFQVGQTTYAAHAKRVFFNAASTSLLVLEQADEASGMLYDFRLQVIPMTPPTSCGAAFESASAEIIASGAIGSVNITASAECPGCRCQRCIMD